MKKLFFLLMACFLHLTMQGGEDILFRTLDVKSGLSDNYVKDIVRDQYGFVWFATSNGVNRYDGYQFKQYSLSKNGYNDDIFRVMEDGEGCLWIQTQRHLYIYNRLLDRVTDGAQEHLRRLGITGHVDYLTVDDALNLWAITGSYLFYYDFQKHKLTRIKCSTSSPIIGITVKRDVAYALAKNGNFYRISIPQKQLIFENQIKVSTNEWHQIYLDKMGNLWLYTAHSPSDGIFCYVTSTRQWLEIPALERLKKMILTTLVDDGRGHVWIGTENEGVALLDMQSGELKIVQRREGSKSMLPSNHICSLYKDSQNVMWIGTSKRGVAFADLAPCNFHFTRISGEEVVSCLAEDYQKNVWVGFDGKGIVKIDANGVYTYFNKENGGVTTNLITCSLVDHSGQLWIGTYGDGLLSFNGTKFVKPSFSAQTSQASYLRCIVEDEENGLWLGSINNGLVHCLPNGTSERFTIDNSALRTNSITSLHSDHQGRVYVGTSTGFCVYDILRRQFVNQGKSLKLLSDVFVTSLDKDEQGIVWIGTRMGMMVYDEQHDKLYHLTVDDGLSNNYVRSVIVGYNGVWVGTDIGLTLIKSERNTEGGLKFLCTSFNEEDGVGDATFCSDAVCMTANGQCLLGTTNGYLCAGNQQFSIVYPNVKVVFTGLAVNNQHIEVGDKSGILKCNLLLEKSISLNYDQNDFTLDVSAMNFARQPKLYYMYRLKGTDDRWTRLKDNHITFNALPPGTYTLEVKASNQGGWESDVSVLEICIHPPFWRSPMAGIFYLLFAFVSVFFYVKKIKRKHKETLALQKMEMELEQQHQLEEKKMRFFTNISHDLKTPLSLIITPLEKMLSGPLEPAVKTEISLVWRNARLLMDDISQLLDLRKLDEGQGKLRLSHGDFIPFICKIIDNFQYYAKSRNIQLSTRINATSLDMDFDKNKIRRVVMNLLSNAFKYTSTKGSVTITIGTRLVEDREMVFLEVADTGIGISDTNKTRIFNRFFQEEVESEYKGSGIGLHIVKEYVTLHHGRIWVEDNHPQGAVFVVEIPRQQAGGNFVETIEEKLDVEDVKQKVKRMSETTILIVEDNRDFCFFLERCLADEYHILKASNGVEALKVLAENEVNIVVSDVMMPKMDGIQLCHHIKNDINFSHIPVILLTAKSTDENVIDGLRDGADDYITKPFNLQIFKLRVKKILEWTSRNHQRFAKSPDISPSEITVSSLDEQLIEKAIKQVELNMDNSAFTVEDFSTAVGMTRGHLYKKLMTITGKSPLEFIRTIRIKRGRSLLEQGRTNISEVAYAIGFSPKQFSKYFKEEYGCLPSDFIKSR